MPWELGGFMEQEAVSTGMRLLAEEEAQRNQLESSNIFEEVVLLESSRYMRNQLLRDTDWIGMAHSLEIRVPLVDFQLTEAVVGLASSGRLGAGKSALYNTLKKQLPENIRNRPKTGFITPTWRWLRHHEGLDAWRRIPYLRQSRLNDPRRCAYTILHKVPEAHAFLSEAS